MQSRSDWADSQMANRHTLLRVYELLLGRYGPQHWWPGDSRFEVMVGAVLTQAASWTNVEKAIGNLKASGALSPKALRNIGQDDLAQTIHPVGYHNSKARKLKALANYLGRRFDDDLDAMADEDTGTLRAELLGVHGIGEETADAILLYAAGGPVFVVDAYTRRLFFRLGLAPQAGRYSTYQDLFMETLSPEPGLFGEYHALIVRHGKEVCRKRPLCHDCCLLDSCPTGKANLAGSEPEGWAGRRT